MERKFPFWFGCSQIQDKGPCVPLMQMQMHIRTYTHTFERTFWHVSFTRVSCSILFFNTYFLLSHLSERYSSFEGLQVEECGILNDCENGRCVRVEEGYTCDCFDGFQLDLKLMACVGK